MTVLSLTNVQFKCASRSILKKVSLEVTGGDWLAIAGRNGSGKSTLLRLMADLIKPTSGKIYLDGIHYEKIRNIQQQLSIMSQRSQAIEEMNVLELVKLGRYPYLSSWQFNLSSKDLNYVDEAIDFAGLNDLKYRSIGSLSGGERQRAFIALSLAQNTSILLFDEPTNHLDIVAQYQILQLLKKLAMQGKLIITVLHDLNHIAKYCNKIALLNEGHLYGFGSIVEQFSSTALSSAYGIDVKVESVNGRLFAEY